MADSLKYSDSITIDAPTSAVYATVSDITRTGEWSPVCQKCWWDDESDGPEIGAYFTGRNVVPGRTWETRSKVIIAEPNKAFGWSVSEGNVHWVYSMEPCGNETTLTESWEFTAKGQEFFVEKFGDKAPEEIEN